MSVSDGKNEGRKAAGSGTETVKLRAGAGKSRPMKTEQANPGVKEKRRPETGEGWGNRLACRFRNLLPWIAVILILVAGYMSVTLIKPLLPDYRNEVVSFEKAERNSPIYLQGDDSIAIYPWSEYDESRLITLEEYLLQVTEQSRPGESDPEVSDPEVPDSEQVRETFREISDFLAPWVIIEDGDMDGLIPSVTCEVTGESVQYYLKDFVIDSSGEEYLASLFFDVENRGFFYHYQNADTGRVSSAQIDEAEDAIKRSIGEIGELYQQWMSDEYQFVVDADQLSALMRENPMIRAWYRMVIMSQQMEMGFMEDILVELIYGLNQAAQGGGNVELVVYRGELLAIFTDEAERRVVVFYDPVQREVSGLSVRISGLSK